MCNDVKHYAAQGAVAYLDIGAGGYLDLGSELPIEQLMGLPKGRHALAIIGTYGIDGYVAAAPGIDHLRSVINALSRNISDAYEKACQNGDERMQTVQNARQSLLNTIREALPQSDASPKGGSDGASIDNSRRGVSGHVEGEPAGCRELVPLLTRAIDAIEFAAKHQGSISGFSSQMDLAKTLREVVAGRKLPMQATSHGSRVTDA